MSILDRLRWRVFCPSCGYRRKFNGDVPEMWEQINKPCKFCAASGCDSVAL
jgi:hypothetical protein